MKRLFVLLPIFLILFNCKKDDTTPVVSPVSAFTFTKDVAVYKSVQFQNASHYITTNSKYLWTFGDGGTSTEENPKYEFKTDGSYTVVLKVSNGSLSDCATQSVLISATTPDTIEDVPQVLFTFSQNGKSIYFQNASSNIISGATYSWTFGDGNSANTENISHVYSNEGIFNVVLKVTQDLKSYSYSRTLFVTSSLYPEYDTLRPIPSFVINYKGNTVYFTNTSSFVTEGTKYTWIFGDASQSDKESPDHTYADGSYNVVLTVKNSKYTVSYSANIQVPLQKISIIDANKKPDAKFVFSQQSNTIFFQNASSNITPNSSYIWTFGDGTSNDVENPFHAYTKAGTYNVVLKVTTDNVSDSYTSTVIIP